MAGHCVCYSLYWNPPPTSKDKLTGSGPTQDSGILTLILAISRTPSPAPTIALAVGSSSDNKLFKQFMKVYLEAQVPAQTSSKVDLEPCKQHFQAWFSDIYYGNLHVDSYWFWQ